MKIYKAYCFYCNKDTDWSYEKGGLDKCLNCNMDVYQKLNKFKKGDFGPKTHKPRCICDSSMTPPKGEMCTICGGYG